MRHHAQLLTAFLLCGMCISIAQGQEFRISKSKPAETLAEAAAKAVHARLISETGALIPGGSAVIGLTFDIAPGWHLYWHNPGDSGLPISWEFDGPDTLRIGEALWPAPDRSISAGDILDYTYSDRVTILLPVELSSEHPMGSAVRVRAKLSWLVCREGCVPGGTEVELAIPTAATSSPGAESARFEQARARLPQPADSLARQGGSVAWQDTTLTVSVPGAESLAFYPYASDFAQPLGLIEDGEANGSTLTIRYRLTGESGSAIRGIVQVNREGRRWYHLVDVSPPTR